MGSLKLSERRYVSVEDLARILPVTRNAIYKMVEKKKIPGATKIGRRVVFREDLLEKWLEEQRIA